MADDKPDYSGAFLLAGFPGGEVPEPLKKFLKPGVLKILSSRIQLKNTASDPLVREDIHDHYLAAEIIEYITACGFSMTGRELSISSYSVAGRSMDFQDPEEQVRMAYSTARRLREKGLNMN